MISRKAPRDQRAVERASGYAASEETARMIRTLTAVTTTLLISAPPRPPCCHASAKLASVGEVVGRIGEDASAGLRPARLTSTYTGKAKTTPTAIMPISSRRVRLV